MGDLLPCPNPWCKRSAPDTEKRHRFGGYTVFCHGCHIDCGVHDEPDQAIAAWNTRALPSATQAGGWMPPEVPLAVKEAFANSVWDALKADANDLRKQRRIVRAFDAAFAPLPPAPEASTQREEARKG